MPCREGNKARQREFQEAKINALPGLLEALDTETVPERSSRCLLLGPSPLRVNEIPVFPHGVSPLFIFWRGEGCYLSSSCPCRSVHTTPRAESPSPRSRPAFQIQKDHK